MTSNAKIVHELVYAIPAHHAPGINNAGDIDNKTSLDTMDSLEKVELVLALEEKFGIEIGDEDVDSFRTVGDVVALIARMCPEVENA